MTLWCWWGRHGELKFDAEKPTLHPDGKPEWGIGPGEYTGSIGVWCIASRCLVGLEALLPAKGECKQVQLHELWGAAKDLPNYDKSVWRNLQRAMGD